MKVLIGAACVAIIAFVGYFFWGEYQSRLELQAREAAAQKLMCNQMVSELKSDTPSPEWKIAHVVSCLNNGHLTKEDFENPKLTGIYDAAKPLLN